MEKPRSDALVFFGASGDLAYKKIFPALQAIARRGKLDCLVIGVARSGWTLDQLVERARASVTEHGGGVDPEAFARLTARLRYVDGDYNDADTFVRLRAELQDSKRPVHYLAIPPSMFRPVVGQLANAHCTENARVILEKPFGRDLASARELNAVLHEHFPETAIFRIDHTHIPARHRLAGRAGLHLHWFNAEAIRTDRPSGLRLPPVVDYRDPKTIFSPVQRIWVASLAR